MSCLPSTAQQRAGASDGAARHGRPRRANNSLRRDRRVSPKPALARITGANLSHRADRDLHGYLENRRSRGGTSIRRYSLQRQRASSLFMVISLTRRLVALASCISTVSPVARSFSPSPLRTCCRQPRPRCRDQQVGPAGLNFVFRRGVSALFNSLEIPTRSTTLAQKADPGATPAKTAQTQKRPHRNVDQEKNCLESNRR